MTRTVWDRLSAASGIGFVVAFIVAFLVVGDLPGFDDSAADTASWYDDNRTRVLVGVVIFGFALALFVWFVGTLANTLRENGEGRPAAVTLVSGAVMAGYGGLQGILVAGLAHSIAQSADAGLVKALNDIQWIVQTLVGFPAVVLVTATGIAILRSSILARWAGWASIATAIVFALSTTTWARDGFWAPDGAYSSIIATLVFMAWAVMLSGLLLQRVLATEERPRPAAMPA